MTVKEMRERRGKCAHDMAELAANLTPENKVKFDALDAEQEDLRVKIEANERAARLEAETRASAPPPNGQPNGQPSAEEQETRYAQAFSNYLKYGWSNRPDKGIRGINDEDRSILSRRTQRVQLDGNDLGQEYRDFNVGASGGAYPGSTTGFFVPVGFVDKIESALKYYGDMLNVATIMPTATGQQLPFPTDNDTTTMGELIGEGQQVTMQDVSIGQILLGAYKFSTKLVKVSIELLQDSAFALEPYLIDKFGIRLGRILNQKFTIGSGTSEPKGIITAATVGLSQSTTPAIQGDDNATSPDPTQQFGYLDLVNLEHSVDRLYRRGAKWMFNDTTLRYFKTLKDKYGKPLWNPGMTANAPDVILTYPYSVNNDMAQLGAGNITVAFGQLEKYLIRRVKEMQVIRLEERFADYGQIAFLAFARYDGNLLDAGTHPVRYGQQHS